MVVGCYGLVVGTYTNHLEKFVEKLYVFYVVSFSKSRKRKKENTMNINSKRKKNPGKEIKHLLFFIVGKVAILSTFFDWRKSMYCTLKFEHWKNCIQSSGVDWLEFFVPVSKYQDVPGYSGNIRENIGFRPKQVNRLVQEKKTKKKKKTAEKYTKESTPPSSLPSFQCSLRISDRPHRPFFFFFFAFALPRRYLSFAYEFSYNDASVFFFLW